MQESLVCSKAQPYRAGPAGTGGPCLVTPSNIPDHPTPPAKLIPFWLGSESVAGQPGGIGMSPGQQRLHGGHVVINGGWDNPIGAWTSPGQGSSSSRPLLS